MAEPRQTVDAALLVAIFSRHDDVHRWAEERLCQEFGAIGFCSLPYAFVQTEYYASTMGKDLKKRFVVFQDLVSLDFLADAKLKTNAIEQELMQRSTYAESRPLNLDPGILTLGKFQLATTKDQGHRIYQSKGIFAEVTLRFEAGMFEPWPWTYADYRLAHVRAFLSEARAYYRIRLKGETQTR